MHCCEHAHTHTHVQNYVHTHTHIYIHTHIHIHIHAYSLTFFHSLAYIFPSSSNTLFLLSYHSHSFTYPLVFTSILFTLLHSFLFHFFTSLFSFIFLPTPQLHSTLSHYFLPLHSITLLSTPLHSYHITLNSTPLYFITSFLHRLEADYVPVIDPDDGNLVSILGYLDVVHLLDQGAYVPSLQLLLLLLLSFLPFLSYFFFAFQLLIFFVLKNYIFIFSVLPVIILNQCHLKFLIFIPILVHHLILFS